MLMKLPALQGVGMRKGLIYTEAMKSVLTGIWSRWNYYPEYQLGFAMLFQQ